MRGMRVLRSLTLRLASPSGNPERSPKRKRGEQKPNGAPTGEVRELLLTQVVIDLVCEFRDDLRQLFGKSTAELFGNAIDLLLCLDRCKIADRGAQVLMWKGSR